MRVTHSLLAFAFAVSALLSISNSIKLNLISTGLLAPGAIFSMESTPSDPATPPVYICFHLVRSFEKGPTTDKCQMNPFVVGSQAIFSRAIWLPLDTRTLVSFNKQALRADLVRLLFRTNETNRVRFDLFMQRPNIIRSDSDFVLEVRLGLCSRMLTDPAALQTAAVKVVQSHLLNTGQRSANKSSMSGSHDSPSHVVPPHVVPHFPKHNAVFGSNSASHASHDSHDSSSHPNTTTPNATTPATSAPSSESGTSNSSGTSASSDDTTTLPVPTTTSSPVNANTPTIRRENVFKSSDSGASSDSGVRPTTPVLPPGQTTQITPTTTTNNPDNTLPTNEIPSDLIIPERRLRVLTEQFLRTNSFFALCGNETRNLTGVFCANPTSTVVRLVLPNFKNCSLMINQSAALQVEEVFSGTQRLKPAQIASSGFVMRSIVSMFVSVFVLLILL